VKGHAPRLAPSPTSYSYAVWRLQNARKLFSGRGSATDPGGRVYSVPPDPVAA